MRENSKIKCMSDEERHDGTSIVISEQELALQPPSMYQVVLFNDDYTPMDFVVFVLQRFFSMDGEKANQIMLEVHTKGKGVCGVYPFDIAETKVAMVQQFVEQNEHPLMCDLQKVD
ncbi:ATP-dependent Clp protease adapter ClpS [Marinomonas sp. C2222]|uniref:ATP-dependent Clp protease adapter protein ClpS n=1 Tax=Marinomonas sargassi TaxID=2984494 RepID=A0ABT2YN42_9GAMM|nr:ATP-dependent Clp protease adapter ClpS [Marinomonas sargassi]MCV2401310.1 ATP-dependent Clp protease adapter ClpS [Marinomonas sargassi]